MRAMSVTQLEQLVKEFHTQSRVLPTRDNLITLTPLSLPLRKWITLDGCMVQTLRQPLTAALSQQLKDLKRVNPLLCASVGNLVYPLNHKNENQHHQKHMIGVT